MINFFRKTRKELADENKIFKYFGYAIGEILLIVIGIFFALQLQNWNENRTQDKEFKIVIQQLYNAINNDNEFFSRDVDVLEYQIELIDQFLNNLDSVTLEDLTYGLFFITYDYEINFNSEAKYHISKLRYNPTNVEQNNITTQITKYINSLTIETMLSSFDISKVLFDLDIPFPTVSGPEYFSRSDSSYYSKEDLIKVKNLAKSNFFRAKLKSYKSKKLIELGWAGNRFHDSRSILNLIKNYYPDVKLLFQDVGIIGTSIDGFDDVGAKSTPMIETNYQNNIWEIEMYLKEGFVKFRCRDSWAQNWGGNSFPTGRAEVDGDNLPVTEAGNYRIILNLSTNTYEFIKLDD